MSIKKQNLSLGSVFKGAGKEDLVYKGSTLVYGVKKYKTLTFTTNGSYTFPAHTFSCVVHVVGSGGSSGGTNFYAHETHCASGGGAGGYSKKQYNATLSGQTVSFTVGQPQATYCSNGYASHFLNQIGGAGNGGIAATGDASQNGGVGGSAFGGDLNTAGNAGAVGSWVNAGGTGAGGVGFAINGTVYGSGGSCTAIGSPISTTGCVIIELGFY